MGTLVPIIVPLIAVNNPLWGIIAVIPQLRLLVWLCQTTLSHSTSYNVFYSEIAAFHILMDTPTC